MLNDPIILESCWRAALALSGSEAVADAALEAVVRAVPAPARAGEGRLLAIVVRSVKSASGQVPGKPGPVAREFGSQLAWESESAWVLRTVVQAPPATVAAALDVPDASPQRVESLVREAELAIGPSAGERATEMAARVSGADADSAMVRVGANLSSFLRRRMALNVLKFVAFFAVLGLVVYVMFDLRAAATREREGRDEGNMFSIPMESVVKPNR